MKSWIKEQLEKVLKYDEIIGLVDDEVISAILISALGN